MTLKTLVRTAVGLVVLLRYPGARDERGLSQSAENAILLAGAVSVAILVVAGITKYVTSHLPK